ncbi:hypothetical protein ACFQ0B_43815 [Nonomuraea thailandensis]
MLDQAPELRMCLPVEVVHLYEERLVPGFERHPIKEAIGAGIGIHEMAHLACGSSFPGADGFVVQPYLRAGDDGWTEAGIDEEQAGRPSWSCRPQQLRRYFSAVPGFPLVDSW